MTHCMVSTVDKQQILFCVAVITKHPSEYLLRTLLTPMLTMKVAELEMIDFSTFVTSD